MPEQNALEMFPEDEDFDYYREHVEFNTEIKEYSYGEDDEELMEEEIIKATVSEASPADAGQTQAAPEPAQAVMAAPAPEVPAILQIAQSAATMPLTIWAMRKLGFSYMDILKTYTLGPSSLFSPGLPYSQFGPPLGQAWDMQQQYGNLWPSSASLADPVIVQLSQIKYFTDYRKIPYTRLLTLPSDPLSFNRFVIDPWRPVGFIPPGQAKKMGLWAPSGQAKKYWKHDGDEDDDDGHGKWKYKGGKGKGKWKD